MSKRVHDRFRVKCSVCHKEMDDDYFKFHRDRVHPKSTATSIRIEKCNEHQTKLKQGVLSFFSKSSFTVSDEQPTDLAETSIQSDPITSTEEDAGSEPTIDKGFSEKYDWVVKRKERRGGNDCRHVMYCKICVQFPEIVRVHTDRFPAICREHGVVFRSALVKSHNESKEHLACLKRYRQIVACKQSALSGETELERLLRLSNKEQEQKIAKLIISAYNDAKRGLSAWSYPSRIIADKMGDEVNLSQPHQTYEPNLAELAYVSPTSHRDFILTISKVEKKRRQLDRSPLAISLRCDGAVDRTNIDNKHLMMKIVTETGDEHTLYLGFAESKSLGADGLYDAIKSACDLSGYNWQSLFSQVSSVCTDGENTNTGTQHSLWVLLQNERTSSESNLPLLKIWCAAHRSQLAFKDMTKEVTEIKHLISDCKAVHTFYNTSSTRTKELKKMAECMNKTVFQYTSVNDIRFVEYTFVLLHTVLRNYDVMISHLQRPDTGDADGILGKWLDSDTLILATFLCDVLSEYKSFQKSIQSDLLTVFQLESLRDSYVKRIHGLLESPKIGGMEEKIEKCDEDITFKGVTLKKRFCRESKKRHLYVTSTNRSVDAVKVEIVMSLINFLNQRLNVEKGIGDQPLGKLLYALSPEAFKNEDATDVQIGQAHATVVPDFDKAHFFSAYRDALVFLGFGPTSDRLLRTLPEVLKLTLANNAWRPVSVAIARVLAAKPHSCDVERLVSAYNSYKDAERSSMSPDTLDAYLNIRLNMPPLADFDVRPAVLEWLQTKSRRERVPQKALSQPWYKGVFLEAEKCNKEEAP